MGVKLGIAKTVKKKHGLAIVILAIIGFAGLAVGGYFLASVVLKPAATDPNATITACSEESVRKVSSSLVYPVDMALLEATANEIKADAGYEADPNCVYVVLTHYINLSDVVESRSELEKLKKVYDADVGYNPIILGYTLGIDSLERLVAQLEKSYTDNVVNYTFTPPFAEEPPIDE